MSKPLNRIRRWLMPALAALSMACDLGAGTIEFDVVLIGTNQYRYDYTLTGFTLAANQEIDIRFDPALYLGLTNAQAGGDFNLVVIQPNNPPGAFGDYSILALVYNPSLAGPFSIEFTYLGSGTPGPQPYYTNEFTPGGQLTQTLDNGVSVFTTPEPAAWLLAATGLLGCLAVRAVRRRRDN